MNLFLKSINVPLQDRKYKLEKEDDKYQKGIEEANQQGNVSYISCQYLDNTIAPYGYKLESPFGFYKLLSKQAKTDFEKAGRDPQPRIILVYGIEPDDEYLSKPEKHIDPPISSFKEAEVNKHYPKLTLGGEKAAKIGKKNQQKKINKEKNLILIFTF